MVPSCLIEEWVVLTGPYLLTGWTDMQVLVRVDRGCGTRVFCGFMVRLVSVGVVVGLLVSLGR